MEEVAAERGTGAPLRGWLSDVLFPTLVERTLGPLTTRLGARATVDHPLFGRATGLPGIERLLAQAAAWLAERGATYSRHTLVVGIDRDVTEGTLSLTHEGRPLTVPVAVVAERRKSREVELRIYHASRLLQSEAAPTRAPLPTHDGDLGLPPVVHEHLEALRRGDVGALLASFQTDGVLRDARGVEHLKSDGSLRSFYEDRTGVAREGGAPSRDGVGYADDGRACAVEFTVRGRGESSAPQPGLTVYERGESGLLRSVRLYEEDES